MAIPAPVPEPEDTPGKTETPPKNLGSGPFHEPLGTTPPKNLGSGPSSTCTDDAPPKRKPGRPKGQGPAGPKRNMRPIKTSPAKRRKEMTQRILSLPADQGPEATGSLLPQDYKRAI